MSFFTQPWGIYSWFWYKDIDWLIYSYFLYWLLPSQNSVTYPFLGQKGKLSTQQTLARFRYRNSSGQTLTTRRLNAAHNSQWVILKLSIKIIFMVERVRRGIRGSSRRDSVATSPSKVGSFVYQLGRLGRSLIISKMPTHGKCGFSLLLLQI